ncbi:MAG TPA: hypothetical protein VIY96_02045, partial [Thermoanaerobaculia bacterium]
DPVAQLRPGRVTAARCRRVSGGEAGLLLVVLLFAILTVAGIALGWVTDSERLVASRDWAASRALYAADAGARWASVRLRTPADFLGRPEFQPPGSFGTVRFPMPAHRHGSLGPFSGDPSEEGIRVEVESPGDLGRRACLDPATGLPSGWSFYRFKVRVRAVESGADAGYAKRVDADVEVGPFPEGSGAERAEAAAAGTAGRGDILVGTHSTGGVSGACESGSFRSVVMNWREP